MIPAALAIDSAAKAREKSPADSRAVRFEKDVAPIFASCAPCHFPGGVMYAKLPFDRAETIRSLGAKLFTRIKDEKEQATLRLFLEQKVERPKAAPRER